MKKILLFTMMVAIYSGAVAQLRLSEQFDNPPFSASGNLGTQNSWVAAGFGTDVQVNYRANNTGALIYPGYTSGRTSVSIARSTGVFSGLDPYKALNASVSTNSNTVVFLSFVIKVTAAQNTGDYCVSFRTAAGGALGRIFVRNNGSSVNFGIETNASSSVDWTGNYTYNTTHLIVMRYDIFDNDNDDDAYLWVNPILPSQPLTGSVQANVSNTGDDDNTSLSALQIFQLGNNACNAELDAFKVAIGTGQATTAANASAAWSNLNAFGATLPVTIGSMKAYEKQAGIQLDWTAYSEVNLSHYQVERSADGRTFIPVGQVNALNTETEKTYGFFDANPLPGVSFYRLKNIDIDAKAEYSSVVRVSLDKSIKEVKLYPNPVAGGYVSFQSSDLLKGDYAARLFNAAGQQVYTQRFSHAGGFINQTIQLPSGAKSGMYTLQLDKEGEKVMTKSFMVQ